MKPVKKLGNFAKKLSLRMTSSSAKPPTPVMRCHRLKATPLLVANQFICEWPLYSLSMYCKLLYQKFTGPGKIFCEIPPVTPSNSQ